MYRWPIEVSTFILPWTDFPGEVSIYIHQLYTVTTIYEHCTYLVWRRQERWHEKERREVGGRRRWFAPGSNPSILCPEAGRVPKDTVLRMEDMRSRELLIRRYPSVISPLNKNIYWNIFIFYFGLFPLFLIFLIYFLTHVLLYMSLLLYTFIYF